MFCECIRKDELNDIGVRKKNKRGIMNDDEVKKVQKNFFFKQIVIGIIDRSVKIIFSILVV